VFERFTEWARQVVVYAQDEARALQHNYIGTEHLLLGLLREERGLAAGVLSGFGITLEAVRERVTAMVGRGEEPLGGGPMPLTPRTKKVLELSLREAMSLGKTDIRTEHILLGLAREHEGVAARIMLDFGADAEKVRNEIVRMLSSERLRMLSRESPEATVSQYGPPREPEPMLAEAWLPLGPPQSRPNLSMLLGWLLFGAALSVGVFIGWLIWG
jgi:ATP-dependent Clp protease ATP-binding subunit ClpC